MNLKPICFYLPQFHAIPENDRWWGEGFTEWSLVKQAKPLFAGHRQPRSPRDGHYQLTDYEVRKHQADLARAHGVHGFCYYHYWFRGRKLLEKPAELMLQDGQPDLPFCFSWGNETWSRRWFGQRDQVLIAQEYGDRADWADHFAYLLSFFQHPNSIRVDGKPVFLIYRVDHIPCLVPMLDYWRQLAKEHGLPGLHIVAMLGEGPPPEFSLDALDAACEFYPSLLWQAPAPGFQLNGMIVRSMEDAWERILDTPRRHLVQYPGAFVAWDNTARRPKGGGFVYVGDRPDRFGDFLQRQRTRLLAMPPLLEPFLFVNAWNEWSEGAHLEPDEKWGEQNLQALKTVTTASETASVVGYENTASSTERLTPFPARKRRHAANPLRQAKAANEHRVIRVDIANLICQRGIQAERVLELGCSSGASGVVFKPILGAKQYDGVERAADAAMLAGKRLDRVWHADLDLTSWSELGVAENSYDLLIALDVLQHLQNPWDALADWVATLRPGGLVITSVPNVGNISVLHQLTLRRSTYDAAGFFDVNHLRFFTWKSVERLLTGAGLKILTNSFIAHPVLDDKSSKDGVFGVQLGHMEVKGLTRQDLQHLSAYQFLTVSQRDPLAESTWAG